MIIYPLPTGEAAIECGGAVLTAAELDALSDLYGWLQHPDATTPGFWYRVRAAFTDPPPAALVLLREARLAVVHGA